MDENEGTQTRQEEQAEKPEKKEKLSRKPLTPGARIGITVGCVFLVILLAVVLLIPFLFITEYRPKESETVEVKGEPALHAQTGKPMTLMTWNLGYGALGDNADFFMDGGKMVMSASKERVQENLEDIFSHIRENDPDLLFVQEIDIKSTRSHHINELKQLREELEGYASSFAYNFKVAFIPYPVPPIGRVESGIATFSRFAVESAERVQLPIPFSGPIRLANLKRCLLVNRIRLDGTDKELVLFNLHLEAYDDGEGKIAQTEELVKLLQEEADKGNYVIAGGDFNQIFSSLDKGLYPIQEGQWAPGTIDTEAFDERWQFLMDPDTPSCRSLIEPYVGADRDTFQYYLIDGFILSSNIHPEELRTLDLGFKATDHNPVLLRFTLLEE
ncbi:MAG: endonuclease/exonuclease/phosphatase family protein [Clostridia bacterium]|nr:endonuclease/exonuclease/phosphatase family protein [Clostridia bacterium]